jgi:hypothetical protein
MPDSSIKAKRDAWHRAKKAIDAVEALALGKKEADSPSEHARRERLLLDRLRREQYAEPVGEAWLQIEQHCKEGDEKGQRVIKSMLHALTLSNNAVLLPDDYRRSMDRLRELTGFADQLTGYFTDEIVRDPTWKIVTRSRLSDLPDFRVTMVPLKRIRTLLQDLADEFSDNFAQVGLTRETKTTVAQRVVFSAAMSDAMRAIFGKWLDDAVRLLTDAALETETSVEQVRHARKNTARRRWRTQASKS